MRVIRYGALLLGLSGLSGCPGHLDQVAWNFQDGGTSALQSNPPTQPYVNPPPPAADAGVTPAPAMDAGVTPVPTPPKVDAMMAAVDASPPPPPADAGMVNPGGTPVCATAAEIAGKILTPKCGACHGKTSPAAGLDLVSPDIKARLLNVAARGCAGKTLVVANPAVGGYFFDKLVGSVSGCGGQMPFGSGPLSVDEMNCLKSWIAP